jgi:hypothetical protein
MIVLDHFWERLEAWNRSMDGVFDSGIERVELFD